MHTAEYFKKNPRLSSFSVEGKKRVVEDFYQQIFNFAQAKNPFLAMRESFASYLIGFAGYQVLCLTEEDKAAAFYSDCPHISGQIYKHIHKAIEHNDELGELKWKHPDISNEELISFCNTRCVLHLYYINGINYVRAEFDDSSIKSKRIVASVIKSMLIWRNTKLEKKLDCQVCCRIVLLP